MWSPSRVKSCWMWSALNRLMNCLTSIHSGLSQWRKAESNVPKSTDIVPHGRRNQHFSADEESSCSGYAGWFLGQETAARENVIGIGRHQRALHRSWSSLFVSTKPRRIEVENLDCNWGTRLHMAVLQVLVEWKAFRSSSRRPESIPNSSSHPIRTQQLEVLAHQTEFFEISCHAFIIAWSSYNKVTLFGIRFGILYTGVYFSDLWLTTGAHTVIRRC